MSDDSLAPAALQRRLSHERLRRGLEKAQRVVRRRLDVGVRGADQLRPPEAIRLFFRPATDSWFIESDGRWYEPASSADIDRLLSLLPLELVDESTMTTEKSSGGVARVVGRPGAESLEFLAPVGEHVRRLVDRVAPRSDLIAEWGDGTHEDGWVETVATLRLDGMRRCWLEAYLPPSFEGDKELALKTPAGRRTTVDVFRLVRGKPIRIPVYDSLEPARGLTITLQTSTPEPADDERPLGFLATGLEVRR